MGSALALATLKTWISEKCISLLA